MSNQFVRVSVPSNLGARTQLALSFATLTSAK
jgi:hypothetical protein